MVGIVLGIRHLLNDFSRQGRVDIAVIVLWRQYNDPIQFRVAQYWRHEQCRVDGIGQSREIGALPEKIGPHRHNAEEIGMRLFEESDQTFEEPCYLVMRGDLRSK